jgi:hypothetical protein
MALSDAGHIPGPLVDALDDSLPLAGLQVGLAQPLFSHGYGDLRHLPTVLVENHSLKPFRQRVLGTYILLEASLKVLAQPDGALRKAIDADEADRPSQVGTGRERPKTPTGKRLFAAMASETRVSRVTDRKEIQWLGKATENIEVNIYEGKPARMLKRPTVYWVPVTKPEVIERLRLHGIRLEVLEQPRIVRVEMARLPKVPQKSGRVQLQMECEAPVKSQTGCIKFEIYEGRTRMQIECEAPVRSQTGCGNSKKQEETYPTGSVRVPTDQPLGNLAMLLLDPASEDSLLVWGFFPEILQQTEYLEPYVLVPMAEAMLQEDAALADEFEKWLQDNPNDAKKPEGRLRWFYERTRYFDERWLLYPVGIE